MNVHKILEHVFFFGVLSAVAYLLWLLIAPFGGVLALAGIVATICFPLHEKIKSRVYKKNPTFASLLSVLTVVVVVVLPLTVLASFLLREAVSMYSVFNSSTYNTFTTTLTEIERIIQKMLPEFSVDISSLVDQIATFFASHLVGIFAGTASTIFYFFIMLIALFYFFRDGKAFTEYLIRLSPLKDIEDTLIIRRIALSIRSVATGTVLVALIQGVLTSIGLSLFGFDRAILWGSIAAIGALIPSVGTSIVFVPAIIYLIVTGSHVLAGGLALWAVLAVGLIDNLLGPYLMSRGSPLHPFVILLSVLGGIAFFGPIGFILGPVIASLFTVLIELYVLYLKL